MQCLTGNAQNLPVALRHLLLRKPKVDAFVQTIDFIPQNGIAEAAERGADLMESSRVQSGLHLRQVIHLTDADKICGGCFGVKVVGGFVERECTFLFDGGVRVVEEPSLCGKG